MKKFLSIFAITLMALVSLTACGGSDDSTPAAPSEITLQGKTSVYVRYETEKVHSFNSGMVALNGKQYILCVRTKSGVTLQGNLVKDEDVDHNLDASYLKIDGTKHYITVQSGLFETSDGNNFTGKIKITCEGQTYIVNYDGTIHKS